jgi:hypothetical protein
MKLFGELPKRKGLRTIRPNQVLTPLTITMVMAIIPGIMGGTKETESHTDPIIITAETNRCRIRITTSQANFLIFSKEYREVLCRSMNTIAPLAKSALRN